MVNCATFYNFSTKIAPHFNREVVVLHAYLLLRLNLGCPGMHTSVAMLQVCMLFLLILNYEENPVPSPQRGMRFKVQGFKD